MDPILNRVAGSVGQHVTVQRAGWHLDRYDLYIVLYPTLEAIQARNAKLTVPDSITTIDVPEETLIRPVVSMNAAHAQELMDSLWEAGLRPTEGTGSAGAMAAVQEHLKDMRRLVFAPPPPDPGLPWCPKCKSYHTDPTLCGEKP
jgi:hypothetical protein